MATKPVSTTPMDRRTVRVDDATWDNYRAACASADVNPSKALRDYMRRYARKRTTA